MRILRVADVPDNRTGGMTRAMYGTGDALVQAGHQVDYVFGDQFQTHGPAKLRRFTVPLRVPFLVRKLQTLGKHYDVVEIHEPLAAASCFFRPFLKDFPPIVVFSHGLEERSRQEELRYWRHKDLPISFKKRYSPLSVVLQARYGTHHCSQVICLNSEDFDYLVQSGVAADYITQLQNGTETNLLEVGSASTQIGQDRTGLLFVGSWLVRKGILDLVPAVTGVLRNHPGLRFTIAGSGLDAETVLRDFAEDVQRQINVVPKFTGNASLTDLYQKHSILVLPSYFEGQPLVMIEAAAFGMAIVATKIGGISDFIQNEVNGLLVRVGEPHELERELERVVGDENLSRQLGEAARLTAQTHTWDKSAHITLQAYERAIRGKKMGRLR